MAGRWDGDRKHLLSLPCGPRSVTLYCPVGKSSANGVKAPAGTSRISSFSALRTSHISAHGNALITSRAAWSWACLAGDSSRALAAQAA